METMQPTLRIGRNVWDKINLPEEEFQERVGKIRLEMKQKGIDVFLLFSLGFNDYGNACYLTNFIIRLPKGAVVIVPQEGEIELMFEGSSRALRTVKTTTWINNIKACRDISKDILTYLEEKQYIPAIIGFAGVKESMPYNQYQFLTDSLKTCTIIDVGPVIEEMKIMKSPRESDQIHRASRIVRHVFDIIPGIVFSDKNEKALEAHMIRAARLEGAGDIRVLLAKPGETKWALKPAEERPIKYGDGVIIYLAVEFERYWAEGIRTFMTHDSSFIESENESVTKLYESILAEMKAGKAVSQVYREATESIRGSGLKYIPDYGFGQGIGLGLNEYPVITETDTTVLKEGMCFTFRLSVKDRALGAVMRGNTIHISKSGSRVFTG